MVVAALGMERAMELATPSACTELLIQLIPMRQPIELAAGGLLPSLSAPSSGAHPMPTKIDYQRMLTKLQHRHVSLLKEAGRLPKGHDRVHKEREAVKCADDIAKLEKTIAQIH
jgi:hypothetical protein